MEQILKDLKEFRKENWRTDLPRSEAYQEYINLYKEE